MMPRWGEIDFSKKKIVVYNWDFLRARSTIGFVREFWQMRIDLFIASKW